MVAVHGQDVGARGVPTARSPNGVALAMREIHNRHLDALASRCGTAQARRMTSSDPLFAVLRDVKLLARRYYELTGRPLGVTAEVAEYEAARLLGVDLSPVRQSGYDAIRATQ